MLHGSIGGARVIFFEGIVPDEIFEDGNKISVFDPKLPVIRAMAPRKAAIPKKMMCIQSKSP